MAYGDLDFDFNFLPGEGKKKQYLAAPEESHSLLSSLGSGALTGLQYVGESLDKPGRAIRGILSGNLREGLAALPFSDYAGITDAKQSVGGRDLLRKYGLVSDEDTWGNWGAGLAAELALDPLTYFGGTALTKAGKLASKTATPAGAIIRGGERGAGGLLTSNMAKEALAGGYLAPTKAARIAAKQANLFEFAAPEFIQSAATKAGLPELRLGIGSGDKAVKFAERAGDVQQKIASLPGIKNVIGLVNQKAGSFVDPELQRIHGDVVRPGMAEGLPELTKANRQNVELVRGLGVESEPWANEFVRAYGENQLSSLSPQSLASVNAFAASNPQGFQQLKSMVDEWKNTNAGMASIKRSLGVNPKEFGSEVLDDLDYLARYGDFTGDVGSATRKTFGTGSASDIARRDYLRDVPVNIIQSISQDPLLVGDAARHIPPVQRRRYIRGKYLSPVGYTGKDQSKIASNLNKWAMSLDDEVLEKGIFPHNPVEDQAIREMRELRTVTNIKARHSGLADNAIKTTTPGRADKGYVLLGDALKQTGLNYNEIDQATGQMIGGAIPTQLQELARRWGNVGSVNDFQVSADLVKKLNTPQQLHKLSTAEMPFGKAFGKVNNLIRAGVTLPFPAFHARNKASGAFTNWLTKAYDPTVEGMSPLKQVYSYLKPELDINDLINSGSIKGLSSDLPWLGATDQEASIALKNLMHDYGVISRGSLGMVDIPQYGIDKLMPSDPGFINPPMASKAIGKLVQGDIAGAASAIKPNPKAILDSLKPFAEDIGGTMEPRWLPKLGDVNMNKDFVVNKALHEGAKAVNDVEFRNRGAQFLAYLKQGYDPAVAKQMVENAHFNYSDISDFEKNMVRPLSSVGYTFARKNLPFHLRQLADDPARLAGTIRVGNKAWELGGPRGFAEGEYDPTMDTYSKGFQVPMGGQYDFEGRPYQNYLSQFGLPVEEAFQRLNFKTDSWLPLDVKATGSELLGLLSPALAKPLELATGTQLYSGKPVEDLKPITGNVLLDQALMGSPVSRVITSARTLADERKSALEKATNLLTGIKFTDVDVERAHKWQERKLMDKIGKDIPQTREFREMYIPKELLGTLTPEQLQQWMAIQAVKKENRKEAAARKKSG